MALAPITFTPIGIYHTAAEYKFALPRQGVFLSAQQGVIELEPHQNFETALRDLQDFERIWVLFHFHRNSNWRPTVNPPIPPRDHPRVGVFASRSPYRPNPIGLSCVRLTHICGRYLTIDESDILDQTPILDIKPYIPQADAFPQAHPGWVQDQDPDAWHVCSTPQFDQQAHTLLELQAPDLLSIATLQLSNHPFNHPRKRVTTTPNQMGVLAIRMFRIQFSFDPSRRSITLQSIHTGYTPEQLASPTFDPYQDKQLHQHLPPLP